MVARLLQLPQKNKKKSVDQIYKFIVICALAFAHSFESLVVVGVVDVVVDDVAAADGVVWLETTVVASLAL